MKSESYERVQQRIRAAALAAIGSIKGGDPTRSQNVSKLVRERLMSKDEARRKRNAAASQRADKRKA